MYRIQKHNVISYTPRHSKAKPCSAQMRCLNVHDASMPTTLDFFQRQRSETLELSRWILSWRFTTQPGLGPIVVWEHHTVTWGFIQGSRNWKEKRALPPAQSHETGWYTYNISYFCVLIFKWIVLWWIETWNSLNQNIICMSIIPSGGASWLVLQVITLFHQPFLGWHHENVGKANHHMPFINIYIHLNMKPI